MADHPRSVLLTSNNKNGVQSDPPTYSCIVNEGKDDEFICFGFKTGRVRTILYYLCGLLSGCIILLLGYWYPHRRIRWTHRPISVDRADVVLTKDNAGEYSICTLDMLTFKSTKPRFACSLLPNFVRNLPKSGDCIIFTFNFLRYVWDPQKATFVELRGLQEGIQINDIQDSAIAGVSQYDRSNLQKLYGSNMIEVPIKSAFRIFCQLALNPFYFFQFFSCVFWMLDEYIELAVFILSATLLSLTVSTYQTRKQLHVIQSMISTSRQIKVCQTSDAGNSEIVELSTALLVPGDVIVMDSVEHMMCDAILLSGSCVVNEALLTGESVPIHKTTLTDAQEETIFSSKKHARQLLYNGTDILQCVPGFGASYGIVIATGFDTVKGRLVKGILNTKPIGFSFFRDSVKFILLIAFVAFCGFLYSAFVLAHHGTPTIHILKRSLDTITIAVFPALPLTLTLGIMMAIRQLRLWNIFCIDMPKINSCGKIKLFCFDKTGTLTEPDLKVVSAFSVGTGTFTEFIDVGHIQDTEFARGLASCHSLTLLGDHIIGDPLDLEIFRSTQCKLETNVNGVGPLNDGPICSVSYNAQCGLMKGFVWKRFPFESHLKRMAVIVTDVDCKSITAYVKGAPEVIRELCFKRTLPADFDSQLSLLTSAGYRVIAYAYKKHRLAMDMFQESLKKVTLEEIENGLIFLGLVVLENPLKPETHNTIHKLHIAKIRTVMLTGDNLYTSTAVGWKCHLLDQESSVCEVNISEEGVVSLATIKMSTNIGTLAGSLRSDEPHLEQSHEHASKEVHIDLWMEAPNLPQLVISGDNLLKLRNMNYKLYEQVLVIGKIFARVTPDQKAFVVEDYKALGFTVGMCGDGSNDCMALKAADAGISLSDSEASIAAPFTSKIHDISCVVKLVREGRAALVTAFTCFKYVVLCSLAQFASLLTLYGIGTMFASNQFLFFDAIFFIPLTFAIVKVRSNPELSVKRPAGKLFHPVYIFSVISQLAIQLGFQLIVLYYLRQLHWYRPPQSFQIDQQNFDPKCFENTMVFVMSGTQYIILVLISLQGPPFQLQFYLSVSVLTLVVALSVLQLFILVYPGRRIQDTLDLVEIPSYAFSFSVITIVIGNAFVSYVCEKLIVPSNVVKRISNFIRRKKAPFNKYKHVLKDVTANELFK